MKTQNKKQDIPISKDKKESTDSNKQLSHNRRTSNQRDSNWMIHPYFNDMFSSSFWPTSFGSSFGSNFGSNETGFMPSCDIKESDKCFSITAELPGMDKKDIKVTCDNGVITIEGERSEKNEEGDENSKYHRVERKYGKFSRSFNCPENANMEDMKAKFNDGVLEICVAKKAIEGDKSRQIEIS